MEIFMLWIILWVIFLIMGYIEKRGIVFGFLAGIWILFLGAFLYTDGLQYRSGIFLTEGTGNCTLSYQYVNYVTPYSNIGMLWALPFILLGMYILWLASTKTSAGWRKR
jgi:hypothetical protein